MKHAQPNKVRQTAEGCPQGKHSAVNSESDLDSVYSVVTIQIF
jgi:hypothetical protein